MLDSGESRKEVIRPDFNQAIMIDFQGPKITSYVGFLLLREIDDRFRIIDSMQNSPGKLEVTLSYEAFLGVYCAQIGPLSRDRWPI